MYKEVPVTANTNEGTWLLFTGDQTEEQGIGDFMRIFKRAPEHCVMEQGRLWVGPVFTEEEQERRW